MLAIGSGLYQRMQDPRFTTVLAGNLQSSGLTFAKASAMAFQSTQSRRTRTGLHFGHGKGTIVIEPNQLINKQWCAYLSVAIGESRACTKRCVVWARAVRRANGASRKTVQGITAQALHTIQM
jgi:hypothetical protein